MKINTPQNWIAMAAISKLISILIQDWILRVLLCEFDRVVKKTPNIWSEKMKLFFTLRKRGESEIIHLSCG
jgi:hypothetical protein